MHFLAVKTSPGGGVTRVAAIFRVSTVVQEFYCIVFYLLFIKILLNLSHTISRLHFTNEETQVQEGSSKATQVAELAFEPGQGEHPQPAAFSTLHSVRHVALLLGSQQVGILITWEINLAS